MKNDLISKHDIEWHDYLVADGNGMYHNEKVAYKSQIDNLSFAQPEVNCQKCIFYGFLGFKQFQTEQKKGKWIPVNNGRGGHECDQCHNYAPAWQTGEEHLTDFCPHCGADMKGE